MFVERGHRKGKRSASELVHGCVKRDWGKECSEGEGGRETKREREREQRERRNQKKRYTRSKDKSEKIMSVGGREKEHGSGH